MYAVLFSIWHNLSYWTWAELNVICNCHSTTINTSIISCLLVQIMFKSRISHSPLYNQELSKLMCLIFFKCNLHFGGQFGWCTHHVESSGSTEEFNEHIKCLLQRYKHSTVNVRVYMTFSTLVCSWKLYFARAYLLTETPRVVCLLARELKAASRPPALPMF